MFLFSCRFVFILCLSSKRPLIVICRPSVCPLFALCLFIVLFVSVLCSLSDLCLSCVCLLSSSFSLFVSFPVNPLSVYSVPFHPFYIMNRFFGFFILSIGFPLVYIFGRSSFYPRDIIPYSLKTHCLRRPSVYVLLRSPKQ